MSKCRSPISYIEVISDERFHRNLRDHGVQADLRKTARSRFWPIEEVAPHWDSFVLRSYILENGKKTLYQEGKLAGMLSPDDLIKDYMSGKTLADGTMMFCGTIAAFARVAVRLRDL